MGDSETGLLTGLFIALSLLFEKRLEETRKRDYLRDFFIVLPDKRTGNTVSALACDLEKDFTRVRASVLLWYSAIFFQGYGTLNSQSSLEVLAYRHSCRRAHSLFSLHPLRLYRFQIDLCLNELSHRNDISRWTSWLKPSGISSEDYDEWLPRVNECAALEGWGNNDRRRAAISTQNGNGAKRLGILL